MAVNGSAHALFAKEVGASPVALSTTDFYTALERGLVDGVQFGIDVHKLAVQEVVKYVLLPPYKTSNNVSMFMNLKTWKNLPKNLQNLVDETMNGLQKDGLIRDISAAKKDWKILQDAGIEGTKLVQEDAEKYVQLYNKTNWEKVKKQVKPGEYEKMRKLATVGKGAAGLPF